jgi:Type I restriction enzyme R protein N terminus (HSDR_N)
VIVADMLADLLGYDKYAEVTTEFAIRGTYVDLAVKVDNQVRFLIEVKAIGVELKDAHVKQAIDYGANQGVEWILLTNGVGWRVYRVHFRQPIDKSLVFDLDLLQVTGRSTPLLECFGNLSREGFTASSMAAIFQQQQATSKYSLAAMLQTEAVLGIVRRELRRAFPGLKIEEEQILAALQNEVLKRELVDSEEAKAATATLKRALRSAERSKAKVETANAPALIAPATDPTPAPTAG